MLVQCTCLRCGTPFSINPSKIAQGRGKYCSQACYYAVPRSATPLADRFWSKVDRHGPLPLERPDLGCCWLWTGARSDRGYGKIGEGRHGGRDLYAHRVAWALAHGAPITDQLLIAHVCDVRNCIRNDTVGTYEVDGVEYERHGHLFLATPQANQRDCELKGRREAKYYPKKPKTIQAPVPAML